MLSSVHKTFRNIYGRAQNVGRKWREEGEKETVFYFPDEISAVAVVAAAAVIITAFWQ